VQPRVYFIEAYFARWGPSINYFVQLPYFVRILAKLLHQSFRWAYIQGILEIGLEVRCDAIKRFELQTMSTGKSKLQFNRRPCRHGGICINSVVLNAFDRIVPAKTRSALSFVHFLVFGSACLGSFSKISCHDRENLH